ncbi:ornithine cyclodeaminase family protein [Fretibacterium sp. OH1220_COT-178]|uniref:ornithine cyclodeaminase family protein n=1 Tax=Fretibacterium sp. OH1220_COT-178 TaxID=2491047 RepID=UPI000F5D79AF|nr:ornithine cyclodeaminase family protein [Fretibacterium sp. OH1220_COT-178]RRD64411.1 ornithine cyclodeaminase family protein [Fretibacterium sp. OH1220_COT-178]
MKITLLSAEEMLSVFSMADAVQADKDALSLYSAGGASIPLRTNIDIPEHKGQSLYMPGYAAEAGALGVKIVSVYPGNIERGLPSVPATMVLLDADTGQVSALMDGTCLTRIRTGAVSGAATDILARKDCRKFALYGTGGQAETQLEAVLTVRSSIERVEVFDISMERAEDFAKRMGERFAGKFKAAIAAARSSGEALEDADVVTAVTTSKVPVFDGAKLKAGAHVNGVGSYTPEMQELDPEALRRAEIVTVDTRDGVLNESGDFIIPQSQGVFSYDRVVELGEVMSGKAKGRSRDDQVTLFKTVGSAVLDVVSARRIYENALKKGLGRTIDL